MIYFLDTEYQQRPDNLPDLISVGIVAEDGQREFYAELSPPVELSKWVADHVVSALSGPVLTVPKLRQQLWDWLETGPRIVKFASDDQLDMQLIFHLLQRFPSNISPARFDLRPLIDTSVYHNAVCRYQSKIGCWHHALFDARAHRAGWLAWMSDRAAK